MQKFIILPKDSAVLAALEKVASTQGIKFSDAHVVMEKSAAMISFRKIKADLSKYDTEIFDEIILPSMRALIEEYIRVGIQIGEIHSGQDLFNYALKKKEDIIFSLYDELEKNRGNFVGDYDFYKLAQKAVENNWESIVMELVHGDFAHKFAPERLEAVG